VCVGVSWVSLGVDGLAANTNVRSAQPLVGSVKIHLRDVVLLYEEFAMQWFCTEACMMAFDAIFFHGVFGCRCEFH